MKKNNIGYLLREGFRGVFLHGFMSFAAICVTVACLIIMGSFCLILYNTSTMVKELEQENEMLVYIDESYSEARAKSVGSQINLITNVRSAVFVSREQALQDFVTHEQMSMEHYLEDQYQIAKAAKVEVLPSGEVVLVCCENSDAVLSAIKTALAA